MDAATFATAYGLSTSAGIRPFMTLAIASIAMHFGFLHPAHAFAFLDANGVTLLLAGLAAVEFVADKVPGVDHALHVLHFAVKPVAAAILVGGAIPDTGFAPDAAMGVAALNAIGVHTGIAAMRGASTTLSAGLANPVVSSIEDVAAIGATMFAILLPIVGAIIALVVSVMVFLLLRTVWHAARTETRAVAVR